MPNKLRILLVGGDASTWVGLSTALGDTTSEIFVRESLDHHSLSSTDGVDAVVLVTASKDVDPCAALREVHAAGLGSRTLVVAETDDERSAAEALELGIAGYLGRGASSAKVAEAVLQVASGGIIFDPVASKVLRSTLDSEKHGSHPTSLMGAARALASALELKDTYTGGHAERVTSLATRLAQAANLQDAQPSEALEAAFLLHDVGKIGIPESILNKPGGLTDTERRVLNTHPILGERIVAPLGFPSCVRQVIRHHHERWDGHGYPDGLAGTDIPTAARVFAIADVIDAMTSMRPYRRPVSFEDAVREVISHAGTQFDPALAALAEETFLSQPVVVLAAPPLSP